MSAQISQRKGFNCGCDPYGVVRNHGVDGSPGSSAPGLWDGYAPHTLICCTPEGVQWGIVAILMNLLEVNQAIQVLKL
jgi:hypothetical protein